MNKAKERWHCICGELDWCEHMCACHVTLGGLIDYCSVHRSAPKLLAACKEFMAARNEMQWDEAAQSIKEAISKAKDR